MTLLFIRTFLLYFLVLLALKLMGKRQLGQLQPAELVVVLVISEMASLAMQSNTTPLAYSLIPIAVITLLQLLVSLANLKSEGLRLLICGRPTVLVARGRFCAQEMARLRLNLSDLQELCRNQGYFDLSAIDYAIMETNGRLSILPRTKKRPLQVEDMLADPPDEQLSRLLVKDGRVNRRELRDSGYDESWLSRQLQQRGIDRPALAFVAGLDERGRFFAQKKEGQA